ncbi:hypothetical protein LTR67_008640 [Exophiala xenobiotica]
MPQGSDKSRKFTAHLFSLAAISPQADFDQNDHLSDYLMYHEIPNGWSRESMSSARRKSEELHGVHSRNVIVLSFLTGSLKNILERRLEQRYGVQRQVPSILADAEHGN